MSTTVGLAGAAGGWEEIQLWRELEYLGSSDLSDHIKATHPAGLSAGRDLTGSQVWQSRGRKSQFCNWLVELQQESTDPLPVQALNVQARAFLLDQGFI